MKTPLITSLISAIALVILACSGSPDPINPNPPTPGPNTGPILTLTDEQRITVLNETSAFAETLGDLKSDAAQQLMVAWLKSRPEFEEAGIEGKNVWAYFHDGRIVMITPDWKDKDSYNGRIATPDSAGRNSTQRAMRTEGIPAGKNVVLFHGLGNAYEDARKHLAKIFAQSHTQYKVESKEATIENLKAVSDVSVFHIDTHGGLARIKPFDKQATTYGLWTSDSVSAAREEFYKKDLDNNLLGYGLALEDRGPGNIPVNEWHYLITPVFVSQYMRFTENAVLYVDACSSLSAAAGSFKEFMMLAAPHKKATYIGWSDLSDQGASLPAAEFVFDRLLGAPVFMLESPAQRPFDLDPVFVALDSYGLGTSRYGGKLEYESIADSEVLLAPSIKYLEIFDYESLLYIDGLFGDNARKDGKVTVGGLTVPIEHWTPKRITCELPITGPGSSGDVVVIVNGHESNKVPLTEWAIPLHLTKDEFGVKIDVHLTLKIRADVHHYRTKPEETPQTDRPDLLQPPPGSMGFLFSAASTGTYSVSGKRSAECVKDCVMRDTETVVDRHGLLPFILEPVVGYNASYKWSPDMKKIDVNVNVLIPGTGMSIDTYTLCDGRGGSMLHSETVLLDIATSSSPLLPVLEFKLDEYYNIQAHEVNETKNIPWGRCEAKGYIKHFAKWPKVTPTSPPKPDTEARYATGAD